MIKEKAWKIRNSTTCKHCGVEFMAIRQLILRGKGRFCSLRCSGLSRGRQSSVSLGTYRGVHAGYKRYRPEHVVIAERIIGKHLPDGAVVHHVNRNPVDNRPSNLVICENNSYHMHLHSRQRVVDAGCDPLTHKHCTMCKEIRPRSGFYKNHIRYDGLNQACNRCVSDAQKKRVRERAEKAIANG